jgi:hypothetical protein
MRLLIGTIILTAAASAFGQEAAARPALPALPAIPALPALPARLSTDILVTGAVKNAPFSATESGETVRVMADGNRIVENWTGTIARNSQGRIRRDITSGQAGANARPVIFGGASGVVAIGTGDGANHVLMSKIDAEVAAARAAGHAPAAPEAVTIYRTGTELEARAVTLAKIETTVAGGGEGIILTPRAEAARAALPKTIEDSKITTRKESLGTRDFGGVSADGVRVITTYLPGAVGNEREIEVSSETWFSKDLGVVVYSKRIDPRVGETTYQMTNIDRSEPDASLFPNK